MSEGQFRFAFFTPAYDATVAFYRDGLELPIFETWDRNPEDRGTIFQAAAGLIEVMALPSSGAGDLWDARPPQGAFMVIEVVEIEARYRRAVEKGLSVSQELKDQSWGHRSFCVRDPNGLTLYFFQEMDRLAILIGSASETGEEEASRAEHAIREHGRC